MISGEKDMLLIDPQFTLSEGHKLAAEILESKKNLATIVEPEPPPLRFAPPLLARGNCFICQSSMVLPCSRRGVTNTFFGCLNWRNALDKLAAQIG
jgi:hypothetical protein